MIDLIVLNYNDAITVTDFVNCIIDYKSIDHIVIVDNASTDDSYTKLSELKSDRVHVILAEKNGGYAKGNNLGIEYAIHSFDSKNIIISNPDVRFDESLIETMTEALKKTGAISVTAKMVCTSTVKLPIAWKLPDYKDCLNEQLYVYSRLRKKTLEYSIDQCEEDFMYVDAIPGSFFMICAVKFKEIGLFDENTFLYYEENILAYRIKEKGYKQLLLTNEIYLHNHSVSINKSIQSEKRRLKLAFDSRCYYCKKYLNINRAQELLLKLVFLIGRFDLLLSKSMMRIYKILRQVRETNEGQ